MNLDVSPYPRGNGSDLLPYILLLILVIIILAALLIWFKMRSNSNRLKAGAAQPDSTWPDPRTTAGPAGAPNDHPGASPGDQPQDGPQPPYPHQGS